MHPLSKYLPNSDYIITSKDLKSETENGTPEGEIFTLISETQKGKLLLDEIALTKGMTFTQKNINDGILVYRNMLLENDNDTSFYIF